MQIRKKSIVDLWGPYWDHIWLILGLFVGCIIRTCKIFIKGYFGMCGDNLQPGGQLETPGLVLEKLIFLNYRTGKSKFLLSIRRTYASTAGYKIQTTLSGQLKKISFSPKILVVIFNGNVRKFTEFGLKCQFLFILYC